MRPARILAFATACMAPVLGAIAQCPPQRLEPPRPWYRAEYGYSLALNERHLVVGDPLDATLCQVTQNCGNGAVHAYRFDEGAGAWARSQTVLSSDIGPYWTFGRSVDLDGDRLIVGASASSRVSPYAGAAYIFEYDGSRWVETGQIEPIEPRDGTGFGRPVRMRATLAAVGEFRRSTVWLYEQTPSGWEFRQKLTDPSGGYEFGAALALIDGWLFVGARYGEGAVYVYRIEPGPTAELVQKLTAPGAEPVLFGYALAAEGDTLVVSAPYDEPDGLLHLYRLEGDRWEWNGSLDPAPDIGFASAVALHGATLVGAAADAALTGRGAIHVFRRDASGAWRRSARLMAEPDPGPFVGFGSALATDGAFVAVGAPDETVRSVDSAGAAYVFDLTCILCRVDLDGDGVLTLFDFLTFFNLFAAGDLAADFDGDGALTLFDFLAFQDEFGAGC
ncbi:MAG: GC-type dockerin domain-anchored protein [Phycisphaerales bacterium JB039]